MGAAVERNDVANLKEFPEYSTRRRGCSGVGLASASALRGLRAHATLRGPTAGNDPCDRTIDLPRAASSAGRALRSQCRGRGFDPPAVHQSPNSPAAIARFTTFGVSPAIVRAS